MSSGRPRIVKRRYELWTEDPRCRRCRVLTMLPVDLAKAYGVPAYQVTKLPPDALQCMATIEHLFTRMEYERKKTGDQHVTLYCYQCNQQCGAFVAASRPCLAAYWRPQPISYSGAFRYA